MPGRPRTRARRDAEAAAAAADAQAKTGSRATKPAKRAHGKRGTGKPRFEPASPADFARVQVGIDKAAGLAQSKMTAADRVERDAGVVAAWSLGLTPPTIGARFGLSPEQVGRIIDAHRERRASLPLPGSHTLLMDALEALESQMERVTLVASRPDASESAMVGAIRTWKEMWVSRLELLQAMGHVSRSPSADARLQRARDLLRGLLDALHEEGVDQAVIDRAANRVLVQGDASNVVTIEGRSSG